MKHRLRNLLCALIVAPLLATPVLVLAEGNGSSNNSTSNSSDSASDNTEKTSTEKSKTKSSSSNDGTGSAADLDKRLTKLKTDFKINLSNSEKEHLKTRCKPAQGVVKTLGERVDQHTGVRTKAYSELSDKLNNLVTKLKAKGVDTATLEQEVTTLQAKIANFTTDLTAYKLTLSDLKGVDCTTDPTAFQAVLTASRTAHDKLVADATDIKTYVSSTIKPTLQAIRAQLEAQEKTNDDTTNKEGSN